mgnify:FL=1
MEGIIKDFMVNRKYAIPTPLCKIMNDNRSDKGGVRHNYTMLYHHLFEGMSKDKLNVFELGLGTNMLDVPSNMGRDGRPGASLYGWSDYFVNSNIYGADIDKRILFNDESRRIKSYFCDQTKPEEILKMWDNNDLKDIEFDIIVEDGLHSVSANITFFTNSIHKLKDGGIYITEDLVRDTVPQYKSFIDLCKRKYKYASIIDLPLPHNTYDNIMIVIQK